MRQRWNVNLTFIFFGCVLFQISETRRNISSPSTLYPVSSQRQGKLFSLFNIVTFMKSDCSTGVGVTGVCMTMAECQAIPESMPTGFCAAGFGVCCLTQVSTCGSVVDQNCTYLVHPGFPEAYTENVGWDYGVRRCADDICFLKLDYEVSKKGVQNV